MKRSKKNPLIEKRSQKYGNNFLIQKCIKTKQLLTFESELEYLVFLTAETNGDILSIEMHPKLSDIIGNNYEVEEEIPGGYLDMKVTYRKGRVEYWEIKYAADLDPKNDSDSAKRAQLQTSLQRAFCQERGLNYRIVTDEDLHLNSEYIENLKYINSLLHQIDWRIIEYQAKPILEKIQQYGRRTVLELRQRFDANEFWSAIAYLFYERRINMDIVNSRLDDFTEVWYED